MWWRSASFILDKQDDAGSSSKPESLSISPPHSSSMVDTFQNPNPTISAYYQTRAAHHGVVTSDWLAQAQAAVGHQPDDQAASDAEPRPSSEESLKPFSVIDEFNNWRKQPDLAEAVAAIRALAAVIRSSEATTMMELEIELKKASDSLKVSCFINPILFLFNPSDWCLEKLNCFGTLLVLSAHIST